MACDTFFLTHKNDADTKGRLGKIREKIPTVVVRRIKKDTWEDNTMAYAIVELAHTVNTRYFWVIDPDVLVDDTFDFSFESNEWTADLMQYWNCESRNSVNRVVGVKLYRTKDVLSGGYEYVDRSYYLDVPNHINGTTMITYFPAKEEYDVVMVDDIRNIENCISQIDTTMFWMVDKCVSPYSEHIKSFVPDEYEQHLIHNFNILLPNGNTVLNGIRLIPENYDIGLQKNVDITMGVLNEIEVVYARTIEEAIPLAKAQKFWVLNPDLDLIEPNVTGSFFPNMYQEETAYVFKMKSKKGKDLGHGGLYFVTNDYDAENVSFLDEFATVTPTICRIPVYRSRDHYDIFLNKSETDYFYWYVDTLVEPLEDFNFDFYPDIHSFENVFSFDGAYGGSGVYLVNKNSLISSELTEEDFLYTRFKNLKHVDEIISRPVSHPVFYFDEGLYPNNTVKIKTVSDITVIDATDLQQAYLEAAKKTKTGYFWAIDNDVELTDYNFLRSHYIEPANKSHFTVWPKENPYTGFMYGYGGVKLCPAEPILHLKPDADKIRKTNFQNKIHVKTNIPRSRDIKYDTVFLSYNEPFADANYETLLKRIPNAKRVHGVKGIFNAHKKAAEISETRMFYVVDADAILLDEFEFEYFPNYWEEDIVHTWRSKNPVNGLIYGYGGLKLFPTMLLRNATDWKVDFTTSVSEKFKPIQVVANYTAFNTDPFNTWKSAFRECTKLAANIIQRGDSTTNLERLKTWCEVGADQPYGEYAIAGANMGKAYGTKYSADEAEISKINDFDWLKAKFEETYNDNSNKRTKSKT